MRFAALLTALLVCLLGAGAAEARTIGGAWVEYADRPGFEYRVCGRRGCTRLIAVECTAFGSRARVAMPYGRYDLPARAFVGDGVWIAFQASAARFVRNGPAVARTGWNGVDVDLTLLPGDAVFELMRTTGEMGVGAPWGEYRVRTGALRSIVPRFRARCGA